MKNIFLILVLAIFVAEYVNPSSIGVRACGDLAAAGAPADSSGQAPSGSETHASTPHFMIPADSFKPADCLPVQGLLVSVSSTANPIILKEIFHPPACPVSSLG